MSIKAFGIALKLTLGGSNQFGNPSTYVFAILVVVCILTQMNYFNKALSQFSTSIVNPLYYVTFTTATLCASFILFGGFNTTNAINTLSLLCGFLIIFSGVYLLNLARTDPDGRVTIGDVDDEGIPTDGLASYSTRRSMQIRRSMDVESIRLTTNSRHGYGPVNTGSAATTTTSAATPHHQQHHRRRSSGLSNQRASFSDRDILMRDYDGSGLSSGPLSGPDIDMPLTSLSVSGSGSNGTALSPSAAAAVAPSSSVLSSGVGAQTIPAPISTAIKHSGSSALSSPLSAGLADLAEDSDEAEEKGHTRRRGSVLSSPGGVVGSVRSKKRTTATATATGFS